MADYGIESIYSLIQEIKMSDQFAKFDELLNYPCVIGFRVIVLADVKDAKDQIINTIKAIDPKSNPKYKGQARPSSKGNYCSYTVEVKVTSTEHIKTLYNKVCALDCVKHMI